MSTEARPRPPGKGAFGLERAQLEELLRPRMAHVFGRIVLFFSLWAGLGALVLSTDSLALRLPLWAAMGFVVTGLIQLAHESWHKNLFKRRWADEAFGTFVGLAVGLSHRAMKHDHLMHHRHSRTERDPDAYNAGADSLGQRALFYSFVLFGLPLSVLYFNVLYPLQHFERGALPGHFARVAAGAALHAAAWYGLWRAGLAADAFAVWIVPVVAASPFNGLKSIADHHGNDWKGDRFHVATTVRSNAFMTFWWCGLNHHLDHHLFPRVPGYNLPRLHAHLRGELERRGAPVYDSYARTMWDALVAGPLVVDDEMSIVSVRSKRGEP